MYLIYFYKFFRLEVGGIKSKNEKKREKQTFVYGNLKYLKKGDDKMEETYYNGQCCTELFCASINFRLQTVGKCTYPVCVHLLIV